MCPGCGKQWGVTQCLACQQVSAHQHWYHVPERQPEGIREQEEPITEA